MKIYIVDSFTNRPFSGNPAAVCLLEKEVDESRMRNIAREMNLSETAFLLKSEDSYSLRWFTPTVEIDLCGHATLASAHILWEKSLHPVEEEIKFHTRSGILTAKRNGDWIELNFPSEPDTECDTPEIMKKAIGVNTIYTGKNRMAHIVEVETEEEVINLKPDFSLISRLDSEGVIVTSKSDREGVDFVSRCFFPQIGINEDPVTGSAHCGLAPYWSRKTGKKEFRALQLSERGGELRLRLESDRLIIAGQAVTVLNGELVD